MDYPVDFEALKRPSRPNHFLMAPDSEAGPKGDAASPLFSLPAGHLYQVALALFSSQPRTETVHTDAVRLQAGFETKTPLIGFTDDVVFQAVEITPETSSLIVYSASRVGYSDLGANRKRVQTWVRALNEAATDS